MQDRTRGAGRISPPTFLEQAPDSDLFTDRMCSLEGEKRGYCSSHVDRRSRFQRNQLRDGSAPIRDDEASALLDLAQQLRQSGLGLNRANFGRQTSSCYCV